MYVVRCGLCNYKGEHRERGEKPLREGEDDGKEERKGNGIHMT